MRNNTPLLYFPHLLHYIIYNFAPRNLINNVTIYEKDCISSNVFRVVLQLWK